MTLTRRQMFVHGSRLLLATGGLGVLSGCQILGVGADESTPESTCPVLAHQQIDEFGVELEFSTTCDATPPRLVGWPEHPTWFFPEFVVYLLPDDHQASSELPINGDQGWFRSAEQLPTGELLDWNDADTITYARQMYSVFTNFRSGYADYYAFIRFDTAPVPGHSTLTLRWDSVRWKADAPEESLRQVARSVRRL